MDKSKKGKILSSLTFLLFLFSLSIFLSLSVFFRILHFNTTGLISKIIIFIPLFLFFVAVLFRYSPLIKDLVKNKQKYLIIFVAFTMMIALYFILPYHVAPFRTVHNLIISVPEESYPITLSAVTTSDNSQIEPTEFGITSSDSSITILPGQRITFQQSMTGSVVLFVKASKLPASVEVNWDGTIIFHQIEQKDKPESIATDPSSWGKPDKKHAILAFLNLVSDGISFVFIFILIFQFLVDFSKKGSSEYEYAYDNNIYYDYRLLIVHFSIILCAVFSLNLKEYSSYLPGIIMGTSLMLWMFTFIRQKIKGDFLIAFILLLSVVSILCNIYLFPKVVEYGYGTLKISKISNSPYSLISVVWPTTTTLLSIDYYKQLDQAFLIVPKNIMETTGLDAERLKLLNNLQGIKTIDYQDILNQTEYNTLIKNKYIIDFTENTRV